MNRWMHRGLSSLVLVASCFAAVGNAADEPRVPDNIRQLMQDRKYGDAVTAIEVLIAKKPADDEPEKFDRDYLAYLKGRALQLDHQYDEAVKAYDKMNADFPKSDWARRARFAKGVTLARKGDFKSAEAVYRAEAEYLLSEKRKGEIADIYLEFADAFFSPPKKDEVQPDFQQALEYFTKAQGVGPEPRTRELIELRIAQCHQALGQHADAAAKLEAFIKQHPDSQLLIEAKFRLGESRLAEGNAVQARRVWQDLIAAHKGSANERVAESAYKISLTYNMPTPQSEAELDLGVASLAAFIKQFPDHNLASEANLRIAQSYAHRGRYIDAVKSLETFIADKRYADREEIPAAQQLLGQALQLQKKYDEALAAWREYLAKYPTHSGWSAVQQAIIDTELLKAEAAFADEKFDDARKLYGEFLAKYPLDGRNQRILYRFGQMLYQEEKYEAAIAEWRKLVSKYPDSNEASQAQLMIGVTLEEKLGKLADALKEYRKLTWGHCVPRAAHRIARLTAKNLEVVTDRIFRSGESPKLRVTTRNIEKLTVRIYSVDLETYFRKMHLARGVEGLDIALIDPDKTFEFSVPKYQEHQQLESEIEVALPQLAGENKDDKEQAAEPNAGVLAVTVSSDTLEATTLVVKSDLDVIVKSSRDEVLVFAQNLKTGQPWPKARVLLSNGEKVFAEATTGDDGVLKAAYEELKNAGDVRVFAIDGGHAASNIVSLSGVSAARGLANKGYIYTDRPAYRPGQMVHVRGVIRQVDGDAYTVAKDKPYKLSVFDNRNRLLSEADVKLNDFGSFHSHLLLPPSSALGEYRVLVADEAGQESYQGTFVVHQYQLEPVQIEVETERNVYYRGEELTGKIRVSYYYGAPVVGREIQYTLAGDDRVLTGKTDDKGEIAFKFDTREFAEAQPLQLTATLPERGLSTARVFFLATQGFRIETTTPRDVYLAGDSFEVNVKTLDAEGKPLAQDLKLSVLEKTVVDGKVGERLAAAHDVKTDAKTGAAKQTLKLADGGRYVLRWEGTDRFGNPITGESAVLISGDDDDVRLRILADAHTFKVGDEAKVELHWRNEPAMALVTFEGARILDYKLVQLAKGENKLTFPVSEKLAPNFNLSIAVMSDAVAAAKVVDDGEPDAAKKPQQAASKTPPQRFHTADSPFAVERALNIKLAIVRKDGKGEPRPGDDVEVTITATDPQGKPVSAELSLAMVEQALLTQFGDPLSEIQAFFRGEDREPSMRTTSSITFRYTPTTNAINSRLLAESERLAVAEDERRRLEALHGDGGLDFAGDGPARPRVAPWEIEATDETIAAAEQGIDAINDPGVANINLGPNSNSGGYANAPNEDDQQYSQTVNGIPAFGLGGVGGGGSGGQGQVQQQADFDSLSDLVRATIKSNSWNDVGGRGELGQFHGYLSLVVSQTQTVPRGQGGYQYFAKLAKDNNNELQYIQRDGTWANLNLARALGGKFDAKRAEVLATALNDRGALVMPQLPPHETAYWNPTVVTDAKGEAKITITLPERSTAWQLLAKGTTAGTLAGEAGDELVVKKDLFGQLKLPAAFTDGDKARVGVSVHNAAIDKGEVTVTLTAKVDGKSVTQTKKIPAKKGIEELMFDVDIALPADAAKIGAPGATAQFDLTVEAGEAKDTALAVVEVKPLGTPVFAIAGGTADADAIAFITPPAGMPLASPRLQILLGPTVERSLLDMVLAPATWCQAEQSYLAAGSDQTVSDLMASLALLKLVSAGRDDGNSQAEALDARVRATLSSLVAGQNDDGGWSWTIGAGSVSNAFNSARVVWALSLAKNAGYRVPEDNFNNATTYLTSQLAATGVADYEAKSILLHALTVSGRSDFTLANQLHRNRNAISSAGLAHLALTFAAMDRKQTAAELLGVLAKRPLAEAGSKRTDAANSLPWNHAEAELRALYALGLEEASPGDADLAKQVDWLLAHRVGNRWSPDKATGPAALVLTQWFARTKFKSEKYTLTIWVNDLKAKEIAVDADALTQTIDVPSELLDPKADAKQTIRFEITGRGRFTYQCVLGGFVPADKLVSTTKDWRVERHYEPAPRELDGREIPRGFDVVQGDFQTFRNPLTQLPVAQRGQVMLNVWRNNVPSSTPESHLEYLVVTEPLPAGVTVIESSVKGGFERFEILPGAITFYVGSRQYIEPIRYDVHGYLPGSYRAAPTMVHDAYGPDAMAVATLKTLDVLPQGDASKDNYRLTPRELYELGQRHFEKHDFAAALPHLSELVDKWNVRPEQYKEAVRMLLDIHVEKGPASAIVKYFEIVVEKYPDLEVSFDKLVKIASAYTKLGEYERGYLVFRTTVETSFLKESQVAGVLEDRGQFQRSIDVMSALLRQYPPEAYTASATYALAQRVYAKAPEAAGDAKLREQKITRVDLIRRALVMLDGFLTAWPEDPAADQAAFSLASAMLDLDIYQETIDVSKKYVERYPESDYLDSFWYIMAFCHYARGEHDEALAMSQKVADAKRRDRATGREIESPNRNRAIYIMGQIYHSLGQASKAIGEYDRVKQFFVDAQQAIDYFQRKDIKLPEVTTFEPGKPAEVELKFRNVAVCDTKVYRIDLVKFGLLKRNLEGIRDINLAGIRPLHEEENKLGDGKDYRDRTEKLALPLKEEGAYLVVCRGENLHTSGLVLVSPLKVEVQEDAESGLVRTTVRNVVKDAYVDDVHVKVIGSANDDFIAGETDLRGVFVADQIQGTSTVLARADTGEYAFYRGEKYLGTPPQAQEPAQQQEGKPQQQGRGKGAAKDELLQQLRMDNSDIQREQNLNLQNLYRNDIKGGAPAEAVLK